MRFSHELKLVLISNWKCGCTSIAEAFSAYTEFDWSTRSLCKDIFGKTYDQMAHYPASLVKFEFQKLGWNFEDYIKISSVRNPWARAVSLYFHLKKLNGSAFWSFDDFVFNTLPNWRSGLINRWSSYEMFNDEGKRAVNYVVRIEHLREELRPIIERHWPTIKIDYSTTLNTTKHKHYSEYYSNRTKGFVASFFRYDIEQWGYTFEE